MRADRLAPRELVAVFIGIDDLPLRDIGGDHAKTSDRRRKQTLLLIDEIVDARHDIGDVESLAREDRDAVIALLTGMECLIARGVERRDRKFGVLELRFLQADDIGSVRSKPIEQARESHVERIHVPACDLHGCTGYGEVTAVVWTVKANRVRRRLQLSVRLRRL